MIRDIHVHNDRNQTSVEIEVLCYPQFVELLFKVAQGEDLTEEELKIFLATLTWE